MGPGLAETFDTPDILAEEGIEYVCDWVNADQPYPMNVLLLLQGHHSLFISRPHLVPSDLPAWDYPYSSLRQIGQEVGLILP